MEELVTFLHATILITSKHLPEAQLWLMKKLWTKKKKKFYEPNNMTQACDVLIRLYQSNSRTKQNQAERTQETMYTRMLGNRTLWITHELQGQTFCFFALWEHLMRECLKTVKTKWSVASVSRQLWICHKTSTVTAYKDGSLHLWLAVLSRPQWHRF